MIALRAEIRAEAGAGEPRTIELVCDDDDKVVRSSGVPDPAAAVAAVRSRKRLLTRGPDPDRRCTMIYGGPQEARISGTLDGRPVRLRVTRTDGCGIGDWRSLQALLGRPPAP